MRRIEVSGRLFTKIPIEWNTHKWIIFFLCGLFWTHSMAVGYNRKKRKRQHHYVKLGVVCDKRNKRRNSYAANAMCLNVLKALSFICYLYCTIVSDHAASAWSQYFFSLLQSFCFLVTLRKLYKHKAIKLVFFMRTLALSRTYFALEPLSESTTGNQ